MTFQEAEKTYKDIRSQHASGKLSDADFETQVNQLKVQDAQGRWWQLGVRTGEWYVNDGQKWVKSKPPSATQPPTMPTSAPEDQEAPQVEKAERPSVLPRGLFAAKPESHNGNGLPRPLLIGIIAVVAIVVLGLLIGGYFLLSSSSLFGGATARATLTPTQAALLLPTLGPTPTSAGTDTPAPTATNVVTATNTVTSTSTVSRPTGPTATRRAATATPTKGAAGPTVTATLAPGIYVTKLTAENVSTDENKFQFVFRITFVNTTGGNWHNPSENGWVVYIFKVDNQDKPYSQTRLIKDIDIPTGTNLVPISDPWAVGPSGAPDCNYIAGAFYLDNNMQRVPFLQPDGKPYRLSFSACK
jgi:hypothetical protein